MAEVSKDRLGIKITSKIKIKKRHEIPLDVRGSTGV
jgi:hypothetical protein